MPLLNPKRPCPLCGAVVPNRHPVGQPYQCERCGAKLQDSRTQNKVEFWADLAVAFGLSWSLRFRGWSLAATTAVVFAGILLLAVPVWERLWPTRLEPYNGGPVF